jgi:F-type H+-transporting ATPase subunit b
MFVLAFAESIQLLPDGTLFIHIGLILAMIWILNRTFFRPINKVIDSRERSKGGHSSEAEGLMAQVGEKQDRYNREVLEARGQGYEIVEKERASAVVEREAAIAAVKNEAAEKFAAEKEELARGTEAARAVIAKEAEVMADKISGRILKG